MSCGLLIEMAKPQALPSLTSIQIVAEGREGNGLSDRDGNMKGRGI